MKVFIFFLAVILIMSCGHFHDAPTVSVWAEGGWLVFWLPFIGGVIFLVLSLISYNSGATKIIDGAVTNIKTKKKPLMKSGKFLFALFLLLIVCPFVLWYFNSSYWR